MQHVRSFEPHRGTDGAVEGGTQLFVVVLERGPRLTATLIGAQHLSRYKLARWHQAVHRH